MPPVADDAGAPSASPSPLALDSGATPQAPSSDGGAEAANAGSCPWGDPDELTSSGAGAPLAAPLPFDCGNLPPRDAALVSGATAGAVIECGAPEPDPLPGNSCGYRPRLNELVFKVVSACYASLADGPAPLHCKTLMLGVRGGVVVDTTVVPDSTDESPCFYACLRAHLIGQRYSCAPSEVWTFGAAGACGPIPG